MDNGLGILIALIVILIFLVYLSSQKSGFTFNNSEYQYSNANVAREYDYYKCINDQCGGNTHDYLCLQRCHLKSYRKGMLAPDIKDRVCEPYFNNPDAYYRCLAATYSDYKYP